MRRAALALLVLALPLAATVPPASAAVGAAPVLPHFQVRTLPGSTGAAEPRNATLPDGTLLSMSNATGGTAAVWASRDHGATWSRTAGDPTGQVSPTTDVDVVTTRTGRIIASELDFSGITFRTSYSDDGGVTWTASTGMLPGDTDRQWLTVGPDDATTHLPRVYLLFHNLGSGSASHNMFVQTSTDGGATFGAPVPTTLPGSQAWADLQCADSGGPSSVFVAPSGRVYAVFGTRTSTVAAAGGCGASVTPGPFEVNVVNANRVWVVTSPDGTAGSWTQSLAVDHSGDGHVVGAQLSPGAVDRQGNVYISFPDSRSSTDFTAAIEYVHAPADLSSWSAPVTVAPLADSGNILADVVAGDAGRLAFTWWHGDAPVGGRAPLWYQHVAVTYDGLSAAPQLASARLSDVPVQAGTANVLLGACGSGPAAGVQNGFTCGRSTDVNGIALDAAGRPYASWPAQVPSSAGTSGNQLTYVAAADSGPSLYADATGPAPVVPEAPLPALLAILGAAGLALGVVRRRRVGR